MLNRKLIILVLIFSTSILRGQNYDSKSFGIGLKCGAPLLDISNSSIRSKLPGGAITPNLFFSIFKHEIMIGVDLWGREIYGAQLNYKYLLLKNNNNGNLFAECKFQYVQFGAGNVWNVKYNYLPPTTITGFGYNLIQNKSFVNTLGIGLRYSFFNRIRLQFSLSGGYNYYESNYSPTNTSHWGVNNYEVGTGFLPIVFLELGISLKLLKEKQNKAR
jgi:hypothetical protein